MGALDGAIESVQRKLVEETVNEIKLTSMKTAIMSKIETLTSKIITNLNSMKVEDFSYYAKLDHVEKDVRVLRELKAQIAILDPFIKNKSNSPFSIKIYWK